MKMSYNPAIYEVLIIQYLRSILDISGGYAVNSSYTRTQAKGKPGGIQQQSTRMYVQKRSKRSWLDKSRRD